MVSPPSCALFFSLWVTGKGRSVLAEHPGLGYLGCTQEVESGLGRAPF